MLESLTRSLSFRLLAVFLVLAALFTYGATVAIRWIYSSDDLRELISGHLALHVEYVRQDIGDPPRIDRAIAITRQVPVDIRIAGPDVNWASDPNFPEMSELQFGKSEIFSEEPDAWLKELKNVEFAVLDEHQFLKIEQGSHAIVVSSPRIADHPSGPDLLPIILGIGLVWLFIAYVAVRWLFSPIDSIREGAARIGSGDFDYRISGYRQDQLGDLAEDVNKLASDVRGMLDAKRHLMLGISHELRSPLSRLRLALEFVEDGDQKEDLRVEITEMEQIVATLLEAERLNTRHAPLNRTTVSVRDLIEQLIADYFARDADRIELRIDDDSMVANVDDARLILLLKNLVSNALRYSEDGPVVLTVSLENSELVIRVADQGPGFSAKQAEHFAEPFYRGDPSRTRQTGGTGLGLYISRLIAGAHGGSLSLDSSYTGGACVVARLMV
ncbi:MAG: HAMP domain-containing histidine kinase [Gammaproteobacteria bacterium]|nr:HAMP domain-containing histidine kinase [Gammaproteobacteria bacterium]MDH4314882.1 HAMP domain-containing histidine kinase [Gammaproteobacteria bacterium]MDH5213794.1 HAMP domain-containing histidine kinase [Gammaproteobacteria bacterium]MDH5500033.1 HAMP domain-containing histidine kinase [Gammaproteobacteria bacterium]